ncbi:MAG: ATP-grasp domain-containing protein [Candidatus Saccharibacteria bacterium]|nr:ATP-grasp domain-containing protein [Candidatus Saccharibacteria bacterium]
MFKIILAELCAELGIKCMNLSDNWVHVLTYKNQTRFIISARFDLNNAASASIADDKVATYSVLNEAKIPAIPHYLVMNTGFSHGRPFTNLDLLKNPCSSFPVVVKPNRGNSGRSVTLCNNQTEINNAAMKLIKSEGAACLSPFVDSTYEYRAFFLDGEILYIYRKTRPEGSFRHNLSGGAHPEPIDQDSELYRSLSALASAAGKALGLRFATVDMLETADGPKVLEINQGVCAGIFAKTVPGGKEIAKNIYRKALQKLFDISS